MSISSDVVIMTREEHRAAEDRAFQRGVARGRFEENHDRLNNPPERAVEKQDPASPDAGGGPFSISRAADRAALAKALFQIERNPNIKDQAWFDFYGKADLILAAIANPQS